MDFQMRRMCSISSRSLRRLFFMFALIVIGNNGFQEIAGTLSLTTMKRIAAQSATKMFESKEEQNIFDSKQAPQLYDNQPFQANTGDRLPLQYLKTGDPLIGAVVDVTNFGAFLDCNICRTGKSGKKKRVLGLLHKSDVDADHILAGQFFPGKKDVAVIRKGEHVQVYVKGVFKQSARFTLTMDPTVDKAKVAEERQKNKKVQLLRRRIKQMKDVEIGEVIMGEIKRVKEFGAFVDIGAQKSSLLTKDCIKNCISKEFTDVRKVLRPGDQVKVKVVNQEGKMIKLELLEIEVDDREIIEHSEYEYYV